MHITQINVNSLQKYAKMEACRKKLFIFKIYLNLKHKVNQIYFKQTYEYTLLFNKTNGGEKRKRKIVTHF